jgi:NAD(P)-dependent dehydrogenase (short-subunit alcohol dehydrogenase family)
MTLPIARELARAGIRVMADRPRHLRHPHAGRHARPGPRLPRRPGPFPSRLGRPEEYAALVRHIVENRMLNGETIRLDGAIRMAPK